MFIHLASTMIYVLSSKVNIFQKYLHYEIKDEYDDDMIVCYELVLLLVDTSA